MKQETLNLLLQLNREFYDGYAKSFSSTRYAIQPGIRRLLPGLLQSENLLDLGCGNGSLAKALLEENYAGRYLGVDNSASLLNDAVAVIPEGKKDQFSFRQIDLSAETHAKTIQPGFDAIVCFAVIQHFPVDPYLQRFFEFAAENLNDAGRFYLSTWHVKHNLRLSSRIQPWSVVGLDQEELSEEDLLLDWRAEPALPPRYRYVHHYDSDSLRQAGQKTGLQLVKEFYSDGKEGDLALYQVWEKPVD
ncbi:MAG: class I SAM-dependent methyltransferase [Anaerolineaceae bacterium]|jgi:SAM-dependent methyltransferase